MKQIINISIGQAGIQLSETLLELYSEEHNITKNARRIQQTELNPQNKDELQNNYNRKAQNMRTLFDESKDSQLRARFMMVDTESDVIDNLKYSQCRQLFNPLYMMAGKDSANTYARGYHSLRNTQFVENYENMLRKIAQSCEYLQGFVLNHGIQGGTGSGTAGLVLEIMSQTYPKIQKTNFLINYQPASCNTPIAPYNTVLGLQMLQNHSDLSIVFDNFSLNKILQCNLDIQSPSYKNLNSLISQVHSSYTLPMRYNDNKLTCDLKEIQTSLVCYPRVHWALPSLVPLINQQDADKGWGNNFSTPFLVNKCFDYTCQLANKRRFQARDRHHPPPTNEYRKISSVLLARGDINEHQLGEAVHAAAKARKWVDYNPLGMKAGLSPHKASRLHINQKDKRLKTSITALTSSLQFSNVLCRISDSFDKLYQRRSFLHWFTRDGMEEGEFSEAREDIAALQKDYEEWDTIGYYGQQQ